MKERYTDGHGNDLTELVEGGEKTTLTKSIIAFSTANRRTAIYWEAGLILSTMRTGVTD